MLTERDREILPKIIRYCERVESKMVGLTRQTLESNLDIKEIICFNILQIGELAKNMSEGFQREYKDVPWKKIKGMRDWVAHGYGTIDLETVWTTITEDIKPLHQYCEKILQANK